MARFGTTLRHAWNVFTNQDIEIKVDLIAEPRYGSRPDRVRLRIPNERSIISSIYTRLSIDVASVDMRHVRTRR